MTQPPHQSPPHLHLSSCLAQPVSNCDPVNAIVLCLDFQYAVAFFFYCKEFEIYTDLDVVISSNHMCLGEHVDLNYNTLGMSWEAGDSYHSEVLLYLSMVMSVKK